MNANEMKSRSFGYGSGLALASVCRASCRRLKTQWTQGRARLRTELRQTFRVPEKLFQLALGEAEALAWQTEFPALVFPDLAVEKVRAVALWHDRQRSLVRRGTAGR